MTAILDRPYTTAPGSCPCDCHSNGAYPPPCTIPGGCHTHHTTTAATRRCAASGKPHPASDRRWLCTAHTVQLGAWLREVEREAAPIQPTAQSYMLNLDRVPALCMDYGAGGGGSTGSGTPAFEQAPARLDAIVHLDPRRGTGVTKALRPSDHDDSDWGLDDTPSIIETLHTWAQQVRTDPARRLSTPTLTLYLGRGARPADLPGPVCEHLCWHPSCGPWITDTIPAPPTVAGERAVLSAHLDWISEQEWVGDMYTDIGDLRAALQRTNDTRPDRPLRGKCPTLLDGGECGGTLWPARPEYTTGEWTATTPAAVSCESCLRRWQGVTELALLRITLDSQRTTRRRAAA